MPQQKQPKSLFSLCVNQAQVLIKTSSENIGKKYGDYSNTRTTLAIEEVQQHLLSVVGGFYIDKIFNTYRPTFFHSMKYTAIFFSICLHGGMIRMTIPTHLIAWKPYETDAELKSFLADFWKAHLPRLKHLKQLKLCQFCDISVLKAVGQHCLKLEILEVDGDISDKGFECLLNCKQLKEINTTDEDAFMSVEAAGLLLRSLPKLESVFCGFLGEALVRMDDVTSLRLVHVKNMAAKPNHIQAVARLCPNIKVLKLENDFEEFFKMSSASLTALVESDIKVPVLELSKFIFGPEMKRLLTQQGIFITNLHMNPEVEGLSLFFSDIKFIGETCPNLKSLHLNVYEITSDNAEIPFNRIFNFLESLTIKAHEWDYTLLQIILTHAWSIRTLNVGCETYEEFFDDVEDEYDGILLTPLDVSLDKLMLFNPLEELRSVTFSGGAEITVATLEVLVDSCPKLCFFDTDDFDFCDSYGFKSLCTRVREQNLDLHFPNDFRYCM